VNLINHNDETGEAVLKVIPSHADTVYYEVGGAPTTGSNRMSGDKLTSGEHETGEPKVWRNTITLKHRVYTKGNRQWLELKAIPTGEILYTTDGSTKESYEFLERLKKFKAQASGLDLNLSASTHDWINLTVAPDRKLSAEQIEKALEGIRAINPEAKVSIEVQQLDFAQGQDLQDWAAETKTTVNEKEVRQNHATQAAK